MRAHPDRPRRPRGIALITVLFSMALIAITVVSFVLLAGGELKSSSLHRDGLRARQLGDVAVNIVIGQLRQATVNPGGLGSPTTWVSQPGAIRIWDTTTHSPDKLFKLYSSADNVVDIRDPARRASLISEELAALQDWDGSGGGASAALSRARFVDLNAPLVKTLTDGTTESHFPVIDPAALSDGVEGFSVDSSPVPGTTLGGTTQGADRIPMPVEWIYLLGDGTMGTLDPTSGTFQSSEGITPDQDNPIVARIAYWTDDESSKLNINTASEGLFWDTPRCATPEDIGYATHLPVKNEVQRFPGHPATTCLSSVLFPGQILDPNDAGGKRALKEIYDLVPAVHYGGGGDGADTGLMSASGDSIRRVPVDFDKDRLYATVDEALFRIDRAENDIFERINRDRLSRNRFFLTANSRSSEVNLFGMPRHCLWPVHSRHHDPNYSNRATAYDRLIAFTSTIGTTGGEGEGRYYHGRGVGGAWSVYFQYGGGGFPESNFQIRNSYLFKNYLRHFARQPIPGYGGTFFAKYGKNIDLGLWFMTEYVRGVNLHDTTTLGSGNRVIPYITNTEANTGQGVVLGGQPAAIAHTGLNTLGLNDFTGTGRTYTLSETALAFICVADKATNSGPPEILDMLNAGEKAVQPALLFEGFCPAQGYHSARPGLEIRLSNSPNLRVNGRTPEAPNGGPTGWRTRGWTWRNLPPHWVGWGGSGGIHMFASRYRANGSEATDIGIHEQGFFRIESGESDIQITNTGVDLTIRRYWEGAGGDVQFFRFDFPSGSFPIPSIDGSAPNTWTWNRRYKEAKNSAEGNLLLEGDQDVVRSLVLPHGDYRHVLVRLRYRSANGALPFVPHPKYHDKSIFHAHSFVASGGDATVIPEAEFPARSLVAGVTYPRDRTPDLPIAPGEPGWPALPASYPFSSDPSETRDWDNGTGIAPDGAYTSKPDDSGIMKDGTVPPYFHGKYENLAVSLAAGEELIAPNRMIASAVQFGSLPSLADDNIPWTTFLFRPNLSPGGHIGTAGATRSSASGTNAPPDHMLLDWFWMPVVQPYAVSEQFSTAGKINMNYQILPFSHIERSTGLHALFKSERLLAVPTGAANSYKNFAAAALNTGWRHHIDAPQTLLQWKEKFARGDLFLSASELCEQFLVPAGSGASYATTAALQAGMKSFWAAHALTGDNVLERPYANIYPRLCTRSNVFRIHYKVQTLQKARSTQHDTFNHDRDTVTGEFQGSTLVERYIEPKDPSIPDYVQELRFGRTPPPLDRFYRFRILHQQRFAP